MNFTNDLSTLKFGIEIEFQFNSETRSDIRSLAAAAGFIADSTGLNVQQEYYNHDTRPHWKIVTDASVNNGGEIVSPILYGQDGIDQLIKIAKALETFATVDASCGLHVHHDATDRDDDFLKRLIRLYAKCEKSIDNFMPPSRRASTGIYCVSLITEGLDSIWNQTKPSPRQFAPTRVTGGRGCKLNMRALTMHGTVEFRHHSGTVDHEKMVNWVLLTFSFMKRCESGRILNSEGDLEFVLDGAGRSVRKFYRNRTRHFGVAV